MSAFASELEIHSRGHADSLLVEIQCSFLFVDSAPRASNGDNRSRTIIPAPSDPNVRFFRLAA